MKILQSLFVCGVSLSLLSGCGDKKPPIKPIPDKATGGHDHGHDHGPAPHGGTIGEFGGGKYHLEFTVDHDKKEAVVYILGGDVKTPAPLKTGKATLSITEPAFDVELIAQPLPGEADGMSSRFVGQHDSLGKVQEFAGTVSAEVEGTPLSGEFKEEAHSHDHDKKK